MLTRLPGWGLLAALVAGSAEEADGATETAEATDDRDAANARPTAATVAHEELTAAVLEDLLAAETVSKEEVAARFGLSPKEFLRALVEDADGRLPQQDLVEATGWSESSVSRHLCRMESDDEIRRIRISHDNVVMIPERMPDRDAEAPAQ